MLNRILQLLDSENIEDVRLGVYLMQNHMSQEEFNKHIYNKRTITKVKGFGNQYFRFKGTIYFNKNCIRSSNSPKTWNYMLKNASDHILYNDESDNDK